MHGLASESGTRSTGAKLDLQIKYKRRTENNKIPGTSKVLYQPV